MLWFPLEKSFKHFQCIQCIWHEGIAQDKPLRFNWFLLNIYYVRIWNIHKLISRHQKPYPLEGWFFGLILIDGLFKQYVVISKIFKVRKREEKELLGVRQHGSLFLKIKSCGRTWRCCLDDHVCCLRWPKVLAVDRSCLIISEQNNQKRVAD